MNTSRTLGRRSANRPTARIAVGASNQFQMPPFQITISASSPRPNASRGPRPPAEGGSSGTPNGTIPMRESSAESWS
jgi:hypothetical protein